MTAYFTDEELSCRCCGRIRLAHGFRDKLNELREAVGHMMIVTSCCRCPKRNVDVGGKANSFHLTSHPWGCCAADISMAGWNSSKVWRFVREAVNRGWSFGINWNHRFIHIDLRSDYPEAGWATPATFPY